MDQRTEWEQRLADLWASIDDLGEGAFLKKVEILVAGLPADSAAAAGIPYDRLLGEIVKLGMAYSPRILS